MKSYLRSKLPPKIWQGIVSTKAQTMYMVEFMSSLVSGKRDIRLRALKRLGIRFVTVPVNNYRMKIDLRDTIISKWLYLYGCWEPYESGLMKELLQPGMIVVDVGAHIGYYSILAATSIGHDGHVYSFEPAPENYGLLTSNVEINRLIESITAENAAVLDDASETRLYLSSYNTGDHRIYQTDPIDDNIFNAGQSRKDLMSIPAVRIDDYLGELGVSKVDMVKIDVQGAEMGVLLSARETLRRNPSLVLFIEYWPHGLMLCGTDPSTLLTFLTKDLGFALYLIDSEQRQLNEIVDPILFAAQACTEDPSVQIDLLACRSRDTIDALTSLGTPI
ncbi:MAG: FkbM family methyltransferase [Anaerolineae bacterium]|nr:FkbM family methyltransferase [Anaerolineae bacterium]